MWVRDQRWEASSLVGLHHWLLEIKPQPLDEVTLIRNGRRLFHGTWSGMVEDDPTLW